MIKITLNDISSLLELPVSNINYDSPISDFSIDSRTIKKGDAYIAIEGEKYNGNDFVLDAIKNGATIAFTSNKEISCTKYILRKRWQRVSEKNSRIHYENNKSKSNCSNRK